MKKYERIIQIIANRVERRGRTSMLMFYTVEFFSYVGLCQEKGNEVRVLLNLLTILHLLPEQLLIMAGKY